MALKYKLIAAQLRRQILDGTYPPGSLLPTEQQLCELHQVSRQTIRTALQDLADGGLIQRRQGSGSRVLDTRQITQQPQRTIAIITTNITDYIFPGVLREAEAVLSANNGAALLYATSNQVSQERRILLDLLSQKKIDGILVEREEISPHYQQLTEILGDNPLSIVEVACPLEICRDRNIVRGDRYENQSTEQAELMAKDIRYAMTVHTDKHTPEECAEAIVRALMR